MSDSDVRKIIDKLQKLNALNLARERVRQLEKELHGQATRHYAPPQIPLFLSTHAPLRRA